MQGEISFPGIGEVVEETLGRVGTSSMHSVEDVMEVDERSREVARGIVKSRGRDGVAFVPVGPRAAVTGQC